MAMQVSLILMLVTSLVACEENVTHPVVTLSHGGQVNGTQLQLNGSDIAVFYGIPYAQPPVGPLRFKKTQPADAWEGIIDATVNNLKCCPQVAYVGAGQYIGDEDCLVLDVYVPSGIIPSAEKKAVMVWIHGGGYTQGSGSEFPMMGLSSVGDVIVVTVNYRLGPLGFLNQAGRKRVGNFGLWDIRQALIWVQENIENFGGEKTKVTVFGHSAGGAAVSALTLSNQVDGLFHRAICQSGVLYSSWSWGQDDRQRAKIDEQTAAIFNCANDIPLFECLVDVSAEDLVMKTSGTNYLFRFHPFADEDFLGVDADLQSFNSSRRFDLVSGSTGQDGLVIIAALEAPPILEADNTTLDDGLTSDQVKRILSNMCESITLYSKELCAYYVYKEYFDNAATNRERTLALVDFSTDSFMAAEGRRALMAHADGDKSTYGYLYTDIHSGDPYVQTPKWLKLQADHNNENPVLLCGHMLRQNYDFLNRVLYNGKWNGSTANFILTQKAESVPLSKTLIRYWTNFAKSGNPNMPVIHQGEPYWPVFNIKDRKLMELNLNSQVTVTPRDMLLQSFDEHLMTAQRARMKSERFPSQSFTTAPPTMEITSTPKSSGNVLTYPWLIVLVSSVWWSINGAILVELLNSVF